MEKEREVLRVELDKLKSLQDKERTQNVSAKEEIQQLQAKISKLEQLLKQIQESQSSKEKGIKIYIELSILSKSISQCIYAHSHSH